MKLRNIALSVAILFSSVAQAGIIFPTQNYIGKKTEFSSQKTSIFYIDNSQGTKDEEYTVTVQKWTGYDKEKGSILEQTEDLKVFPEHVIVPAGKRVPVKVLLKKDNPINQEYYRINFKDDPEAKKNKDTSIKEDSGMVKINIPFIYSIPIFSQPKELTTIKSEINTTVVNGKTQIKNTGNVLYRVESYKKAGVEKKHMIYLFPGDITEISDIDIEIVGRSFGVNQKWNIRDPYWVS